jgi:hypothetical protein
MKTELFSIKEENRFLKATILLKFPPIIRKLYYFCNNFRHLYIAAYDVESPESLLIEIPEKKA